jgi:superfamily II DNA or RNA helicase
MALVSPSPLGVEGGERSPPLSATGGIAFVPCLRLYTEPLLVDVGMHRAAEEREQVLPVLALSFDYGAGRVRAADRRDRLVASRPAGPVEVWRDREGERRACHLLESFGPLEIACLDRVSARPGSAADYVVRIDPEVHALCSFSAYALPQLRSFGWQVEVAPEYPWQIVDGDAPWYACVDKDEARTDWFNLELGIEVEGRRINLLPALLELLERLPSSARLDQFAPVGARFFALPVGGNRYVTVPPERLRLLMKVLRELYQPDEARIVRFSAVKATALAELDAAFAGGREGRRDLRWSGNIAIRDRGFALRQGPPGRAAPPRGLQATLRPYQAEGLAWLQHLRTHEAGGVLADDMGLGKTLQAIAHLVTEKEAGRLDRPALVVTPTSLVGNWRRELAKFAPHLKVLVLHGPGRRPLYYKIDHADVVLTTYPVLVRDEERLAQRHFHLVLLDEAQAIKNPRSQAHRAASALKARHRLCLSGTPIENSLSELWAMFEFLMPGFLGDSDWFAQRYVRAIEREGNQERLAWLRAQVAPFILRRTKEEVAPELPPKTEIVRPVELRGAQRDLYESLRVAAHAEVRRAIAQKGLGASTITILDALMKLRQVCCDPRLLPSETAHQVAESAKYELLMELVAQQRERGRRILVFSQFASMLALIAAGLKRAAIPFVALTGATVDRQRPIDAFQNGRADVFLISLKAGGTGLNLTSADTVIHYDPWWNPAAQAQATDRAHRIGQTRPVFVYNLIVAGSVEERMLTLQHRKKALADGVLARPGPPSPNLSEEDVHKLFAPIADEGLENGTDSLAVEAPVWT